jgi:diaminohydroxyphosphoribosylaminopyrimidine deaminase/5-amino-6-(5-phosphoribosylamino)uracil reductase
VEALRAAGARARGATVVCTLEPCSHHGRTPPCTDALIAAGVRRVVIGARDPLERGRRGGAAVLRSAGIEVAAAEGPEAEACRELNAPFLTHALTGRPLVTLKMAASLDGRVATVTGETRWISGPEARALVHRLRADSDAVMVGIGTALADDPDLTARDVPGAVRQPRRVVVDSRARLPPGSALARRAREVPLTVVTAPGAPSDALVATGAEVVRVPAIASGVDLGAALDALGALGVQSVLVEGGPGLAAGLLAARAVDRVAWFVAPVLIGGEGAPGAVAGGGTGPLASAPRLRGHEIARVGDDVLITGRLRDLPGG